jgi:hypothetical protein
MARVYELCHAFRIPKPFENTLPNNTYRSLFCASKYLRMSDSYKPMSAQNVRLPKYWKIFTFPRKLIITLLRTGIRNLKVQVYLVRESRHCNWYNDFFITL